MNEPLDLDAIEARASIRIEGFLPADLVETLTHWQRDVPALIARVRELEAAIDSIGTVIDDPEGWGWTDQDGMLESIGNTVESAGRPVIWQ